MDAIDLVLNGALIATALAMAGPFWRARASNPAGWPGAGLFAAVAAYALLRILVAENARPVWIGLAQALAVSGPFWFWRLSYALFDPARGGPGRWRWSLLVALEALALGRFLEAPERAWASFSIRALALALIIHGLWIILREWRGELVEARLRARVRLLLAAGLLALFTLARPWVAQLAPGLASITARAAPLIDIALMVWAARTLFRVERELYAPKPRAAPTEAPDPDAADLARLDALMDAQIWREPGLTIAQLAARVGAPEYRLRRLILERRGARNFAAFMAEARLTEAAARLAEPKEARQSIAAIAFESGFASLGPFNRAFRERFGVTPTAYRKGERALPEAQNLSPNP